MLTYNKKKHQTQSTGLSKNPKNPKMRPKNLMEIGAWPKFPSTEMFLNIEIPTPISPIPDLEKINDDSIQETAKVPNSIHLSTVEKKTERKNGHVTFVPPKTDAKEEKIPTETKVLSKTPEYPPLKEKAQPINLKPISGLEKLNVELMQLKQVRPV